MPEKTTTSRRTAKLYFRKDYAQLAKTMAASIRSQNTLCNLVDQQYFMGVDDVEVAALVLIQLGTKKADLIATCYEKFGNDGVEIVFFNDDGKVVPRNGPENSSGPEAKPVEPVAAAEDAGTDEGTDAAGPASIQEGDSVSDPDPADV